MLEHDNECDACNRLLGRLTPLPEKFIFFTAMPYNTWVKKMYLDAKEESEIAADFFDAPLGKAWKPNPYQAEMMQEFDDPQDEVSR